MSEHLFFLSPKPGLSLQAQIKAMLVSAILDGHLLPGDPVPSGRKLSQTLNVSRNTVVLVYERMVEEGYLVARERLGYFVNPEIESGVLKLAPNSVSDDKESEITAIDTLNWSGRFRVNPSSQINLKKPEQWRECRYPFIFGQLDPELFPVAEWRDCTRQATSSLLTREWLGDNVDADDPMLVEQLRSRVLPRRGIRCSKHEILITLGTQQSLYMLSQLLTGKGTRFGVESPGYVDVRNIVELTGATISPLEVDDQGLVIDRAAKNCDYLYVTPSHQSPTTVTMPMERRLELLAMADECDQILIEDDYESEISFSNQPTPALKSLDKSNRVIYVGSLSKTLSPGLRLGYLVGPAEFIREARALRRLMLRHPPTNNQRTLALFLAGGHHDTLIRRLTQVYRERYVILMRAISDHLPAFTVSKTTGGSSVWLRGPKDLEVTALQQLGLQHGVFIEPGRAFFYGATVAAKQAPDNYMRLGFSAIPTDRIEEGIKVLASLLGQSS
jgi:GntR family transcriptional regulator / MocR family aminotransferase